MSGKSSKAAWLLAAGVIVLTAAAACSSSGGTVRTVEPAATNAEPAAAASAGPLVSQDDWARGRIDAAQAIWGFTAEGRAWQESYDFRQMRGQPAWFGSTGVNGWAGAGQAIPQSVMHELGHSFWGAFPVNEPGAAPDEQAVTALQRAYRDDLLTFMRQPPDSFEPLRDRFRNLPNIDRGAYPDLAHFGEADFVYLTGGDIDLVPPILRKYFSSYLSPSGVAGDAGSWADAIRWWSGLDADEMESAGQVFGLQHFPLSDYKGIEAQQDAGLRAELTAVLEGEERQRLIDFADQFDEVKMDRSALTDAAGVDRGFNFWARYLREMSQLHRDYPEVLAGLTGARGQALGAALDLYDAMSGLSPSDQAARYREVARTPHVRDLAPLLKARTLLALFPADAGAGTEGIEAVADAYAQELRELVAIADGVLETGAADPAAAAAELADRVTPFTDAELAGRIDTIFDTMREAEPGVTRAVLAELPRTFLLRLLSVRPSAARAGELPPERLLAAAGVTREASADALVEGIALLAEQSSGNFAIDAPFDDAVYSLLDNLSRSDPALVLRVFAETELRPLPWVASRPEAAARALGSNPAATVAVLLRYDGPEPTSERVIRRLAYTDAATAAALLAAALEVGRGDVLTGVLNALAYDAYWTGLGVGPDGRMKSAAALLLSLRDLIGEERVTGMVAGGAADYSRSVTAGELEPAYRDRHLDTLRALAEMSDSAGERSFFERLSSAVRDA